MDDNVTTTTTTTEAVPSAVWGGKRVLVSEGDTFLPTAAKHFSRALFYPSLVYNLAKTNFATNWDWYNQVGDHILLGALPFKSHLKDLQDQGVKAVVTLNQNFELFCKTDDFKKRGINHLHIPTVDFLFAPSVEDLKRGTEFIREHVERGEKVYVHCKAGRGRSTVMVLCYLIRYEDMMPSKALDLIKKKRPQVCLATGQWNAVCGFYRLAKEGGLS